MTLKKSAVQGRVSEGAPGFPKRQMKFSYTDTPDRLQRVLDLARHLAFNLGISALETFVKLEGEGNVDLHHLHLRYARRMCHYASTPSEHQFVAVNTKYDHVPDDKQEDSAEAYRHDEHEENVRQLSHGY